MAESYVGQIRIFAGNYAPQNFALCDGSLLPIQGNETLFSIIGTTHGGNGLSNFALPDMRGKVPIHRGSGPGLTPSAMGSFGGLEVVTIGAGEMPAHTHALMGSESPAVRVSAQESDVLAEPQGRIYATAGTAPATMSPDAVVMVGAPLPHNNMQPFVCLNFIICIKGSVPLRG